jgi:TetR/AcrR family transcriptional regulator
MAKIHERQLNFPANIVSNRLLTNHGMPPSEQTRSTVARLRSPARQTQIIETVIALAAEHSPGQITMQEIANAIGLTQGALFRHFPNKEAIWLAAIDWLEETLLGRLESAASEAANPLDALRKVFFSHVDFVVARPGVPRLIFNELQQAADSPIKAAVRKMLGRYRQLVCGLIETAAKRGDIARNTDSGAATVLFIGSLQGLVMQSMLADNVSAMGQAAQRIFPLFLNSLKED